MVTIQPGVAVYVSWDNAYHGTDARIVLYRYDQDRVITPYAVDTFHTPPGMNCPEPSTAISADRSRFYVVWTWNDGTSSHSFLRVFSWAPFVLLHEYELPVYSGVWPYRNAFLISPSPNGGPLLYHQDPVTGHADYYYTVSEETGALSVIATVPSTWNTTFVGGLWSDGDVVPVAYEDSATFATHWETLGFKGLTPMSPDGAGNSMDFLAPLNGESPNYMYVDWYDSRNLRVYNADFTDATKTPFPLPPTDPLSGGTPAFDTSEGPFVARMRSVGPNVYMLGGPPAIQNFSGTRWPGRMWICQVFAAYSSPATFGQPFATTTPEFGGSFSYGLAPRIGPGTLQIDETPGAATDLARQIYFWDGTGLDMSYVEVPLQGTYMIPIAIMPDPYRLGNLTGAPYDQGRTFGRPS